MKKNSMRMTLLAGLLGLSMTAQAETPDFCEVFAQGVLNGHEAASIGMSLFDAFLLVDKHSEPGKVRDFMRVATQTGYQMHHNGISQVVAYESSLRICKRETGRVPSGVAL